MEILYLVKIGEILLKLGNQDEFIDRLRKDLARRLESVGGCRLEYFPGRLFVYGPAQKAPRIEAVLKTVPGINAYARAERVDKKPQAVFDAAIRAAAPALAAGKRGFKAESRRSDKSFPLGSFELSAAIGERVLARFPETRVDLHNPEFTINAEIRERAYVYVDSLPGMRGLPIGSGGKGLLLLSGGIDSPVAGYLMATRGLALEAVYFHAYPYTSQEAQDKVVRLASIIARFTGGMRLNIVPFTEVQLSIKKNARQDLSTIMMRAAMMSIADRLASTIKANCLVTGESLGQVASQTAENLGFTQSLTRYPVLRPLIGADKEHTVALARSIGTYDTSILPYEDCCVLFSPKHPILRADFDRATEAYRALELDPLLERALAARESRDLPYSPPPEAMEDNRENHT